ncbi:MAG: hypothetical protein C4554_00710 [Dethiobacter sp.]|jgi:uncharacterized RDD family membrane protein YckC|nr:MAG: hypothetical protein C4554_00710 [Dethiobacter sp.]
MSMRRIFAFLVDAVVASLLSLVPFIGWLIGFFYMLLRDGLTESGSPGKKLLNLHVTTKYGEQITYMESFRRNVIFAFPVILSIIPLIGWIISGLLSIVIYVIELLAMANDPRGRRNGDRWAGTIVREESIYY